MRNVWPVSKSQRRSVRSSEAEIACRPSGGLIATALTELVWPCRVRIRKSPDGVELLFGGRRRARFSVASFGTGSALGCWTPAPSKLTGTASFPLWLTVELAGPIQPVDPPPVATPTCSLDCRGPPGVAGPSEFPFPLELSVLVELLDAAEVLVPAELSDPPLPTEVPGLVDPS